MNEYSFKQTDPDMTEIAVGVSFNPNRKYAAESLYYSSGCPAPRKIIADAGAAVDLIGARDSHHKDRQGKTSEPIHFCTANGITRADTIVQYYSPALEEQVSPHVLSDSVSALSIGKRIASGCESHWMPKKDDKVGPCTLIEPDGKRIEFKVDGHDVPDFMEQRETTAVPASIDNTISMVMPAAAPASQTRRGPSRNGSRRALAR